MRDTQLFQLALGLVPPWLVKAAKFDAEARRLDIEIDFSRGGRFPCPHCKTIDCPVHDTTMQTWLLPEHHVLLRPGQCPPCADAPFQRAANTGTDLGMAPSDLPNYGDGPDARVGLQDPQDFAVPDIDERVGRRRPRGAFFWEGRRGSASIR